MVSGSNPKNPDDYCEFASKSLDLIFRENNITLAHWFKTDDIGVSDHLINFWLDRIQVNGRSM